MPVIRAGSLTGRRVLAAVGVVLACVLAAPGLAGAETFKVSSTADEMDAALGDEFCVTAAGKCTLRAALEEANFTSEAFDAIGFEEEVFEGDGDSVIEPATPLPAITAPLELSGRRCETEAGVGGPCVEIRVDSAEPALSVEGAAGVLVESLALTGAAVGLDAEEARELWVKESWFGIGLDGGATGNVTGIRLGAGSDRSRIGGEGPEAGNLIASSTGVGLDVFGASGARILGNRFGLAPTGTTASNQVNVAISSSQTSAAINNTIGTRVSPDAAATAACDGGCNLISPALSTGVELAGDGGDRLPPVGTTIAGNMIGFDATGAGGPSGAGAGIYVEAPNTTIGGAREGDANRISGGTAAIEVASGSPDLVIRRNLIGSTAGAAPTEAGISIDSTGLFPVEEAVVLENDVGLGGNGTGISNSGMGAEISGNLVEGAATGIEVQGDGFENLIDSNVVVESTDVGVLVKGPLNRIVGNEIAGGQEAGVRIEGSGPFGVSGNVVGGDTATTENTIDGSTGAAIEIESPEESRNEVARNRGSANGGPFIHLVEPDPDLANPEPGPPNGGILPPAIAAISEAGAAGFAEPGATVSVFRKATPATGEIASFLGQATADEGGNWSFTYPAPLPVGAAIAATQTLAGGTSELEIATVPPAAAGQRPPAAETAADRKPPRTRMLRQARRVPQGGVARFAFTSSEPGSRFQCRLDSGKYRACKSPKRYRGLRPGKHVFRVRAVDGAGNVDRTPVRRRFEVLG
ncbi:MAG TPA: NosD domain-containing protein [Solirubrobacterales bacterium]